MRCGDRVLQLCLVSLVYSASIVNIGHTEVESPAHSSDEESHVKIRSTLNVPGSDSHTSQSHARLGKRKATVDCGKRMPQRRRHTGTQRLGLSEEDRRDMREIKVPNPLADISALSYAQQNEELLKAHALKTREASRAPSGDTESHSVCMRPRPKPTFQKLSDEERKDSLPETLTADSESLSLSQRIYGLMSGLFAALALANMVVSAWQGSYGTQHMAAAGKAVLWILRAVLPAYRAQIDRGIAVVSMASLLVTAHTVLSAVLESVNGQDIALIVAQVVSLLREAISDPNRAVGRFADGIWQVVSSVFGPMPPNEPLLLIAPPPPSMCAVVDRGATVYSRALVPFGTVFEAKCTPGPDIVDLSSAASLLQSLAHPILEMLGASAEHAAAVYEHYVMPALDSLKSIRPEDLKLAWNTAAKGVNLVSTVVVGAYLMAIGRYYF